jgi:hypothetical protein
MNHPDPEVAPNDEVASEDEVARLQRLVYGADSTPDERRRATEQLQTLATATDAAADPSPDAGEREHPGGDASSSAGTQTAHAARRDSPAPDDEPGRGRRIAIRIGIVAGAAALVLGIVAGWQLAQLSGADAADAGPSAALTAVPTESAGPRLQADVLAAMPVAAHTLAARVFLRPAVPEDTPDYPGESVAPRYTPGGGPLEFRRLATRADGTTFFAARDGEDLCLVIVFVPEPDSISSMGTCTESGRFPNEGLQLSGSAGPGTESVDATWRPDGSIQIGVITGAPPGE